jgi:hypothetical protein
MSNGNQGGGPNVSPLWPADNSAVTSHITMLQGIVNRLAGASASCKTWCITLVAALVSLAGSTRTPAIVTVALVPVVVFAFLDTMYLSQERAYRQLYATIIAKVRDGSYARTDAFEATAPLSFGGFLGAFCSWSVFPVYLGLIAIYLIARLGGWLQLLAQPATR